MLIQLTHSKDGKAFLLNTNLIDSVVANSSGSGSVIHLSNGKFHFVVEEVDDILAKIKLEKYNQ